MLSSSSVYLGVLICYKNCIDTMTTEQKDAAASVLISQKFTKGQTIVNEGDSASSFYIIKEVKNIKISMF